MNRYLLSSFLLYLLVLTACQKEQVKKSADETLTSQAISSSVTAAATSDQLDLILKDLPVGTYRLEFPNMPANPAITKPLYGTLTDLTRAPIKNFYLPALTSLNYGWWVPHWIWPIIIPGPSCMDIINDPTVSDKVLQLAKQQGLPYFNNVIAIDAGQGQMILESKDYFSKLSSIKTDDIDNKILNGIPLNSFRLALPGNVQQPYFTRLFYGTGDIKGVKAGNGDLSDYIKMFPKYIGCLDPIILDKIRLNALNYDKNVFGNLNIQSVGSGVGVLVYK
ncbi:hypothetical protein CLV51_1087 [Chitinophaga niastensis]|uniref:Uncharacterized protein n=1 Tax=Chitinophaga niastensis TaxID=536980 RepID=A0A2P8HAR1_CHINA|nr:hypothetical protein [Chitinophaga niastensis]PSL43318.1 hypothetical protein CLV51_1087 [Chitinophaga niastensis]